MPIFFGQYITVMIIILFCNLVKMVTLAAFYFIQFNFKSKFKVITYIIYKTKVNKNLLMTIERVCSLVCSQF
jgi:hypothetical protein